MAFLLTQNFRKFTSSIFKRVSPVSKIDTKSVQEVRLLYGSDNSLSIMTQIGSYRFDRMELAGSLGDLGTLIPLSVALIVINGLNATAVFLFVGLFYIGTGLYYKLPIPVQPLKVVAAIAIATQLDAATIAASGYLMGIILIIIAATGIVNALARLFTKPIVRGIQLGLGFILIIKGLEFIKKDELLMTGLNQGYVLGGPGGLTGLPGLSINTIIGMFGILIVILLLTNRRLPAAIAVIVFGVIASIGLGSLSGMSFDIGYEPIRIFKPDTAVLLNALILLVIPQIPLTIGNAVMATADTAKGIFGKEKSRRSTFKAFAASMGIANIGAGAIFAMPMCHGAGGLAAHYRFGARTGGSNLMIGTIFLVIAIVFGKAAISIFSLIPNSILGVLLLFAGLELAMLIRDVTEKKDLFVAFFIAGIGLATTNMGIAFIAGMTLLYIINAMKIKI